MLLLFVVAASAVTFAVVAAVAFVIVVAAAAVVVAVAVAAAAVAPFVHISYCEVLDIAEARQSFMTFVKLPNLIPETFL